MSESLAFLGEEFLTWLWFKIETDGGEFELDQGRHVGVSFDDFIAFAPRDGDESEHTLRKGAPSRSVEAAASLRNGRRLTRARLILAEGDAVWHVVLDGPTMNLLSVKLPDDDPEAADADERSLERVQAFLTLRGTLARLYRQFLLERLDEGYLTSGAEAQANWMAAR